MPNSLLEIVGAILGVIGVWLIAKRNIWGFPVGIVMVILYAIVFYQARLYSDMLLQLAYVVMQIQGWYAWSSGDQGRPDTVTIKRLSGYQWYYIVAVLISGSGVVGYVMWRFTDASLPWMDAFTATMSLIAQWCVNRKYLENWVLWIVVDFIYLFQYSIKGLYFTTALYGVFLSLAFLGLRDWYRAWLRRNAQV